MVQSVCLDGKVQQVVWSLRSFFPIDILQSGQRGVETRVLEKAISEVPGVPAWMIHMFKLLVFDPKYILQ